MSGGASATPLGYSRRQNHVESRALDCRSFAGVGSLSSDCPLTRAFEVAAGRRSLRARRSARWANLRNSSGFLRKNTPAKGVYRPGQRRIWAGTKPSLAVLVRPLSRPFPPFGQQSLSAQLRHPRSGSATSALRRLRPSLGNGRLPDFHCKSVTIAPLVPYVPKAKTASECGEVPEAGTMYWSDYVVIAGIYD